MRGQLTNHLKKFAESKGFGFATDVVPTGLLNEKYPCIFWVAPDTTYDAVAQRWVYPSTFYIVAPKGRAENVSSKIDDLQAISRELFLFLQRDCRFDNEGAFFTDKTMRCNPKTGFDNSGAIAVEVVFNIFESDGCR